MKWECARVVCEGRVQGSANVRGRVTECCVSLVLGGGSGGGGCLGLGEGGHEGSSKGKSMERLCQDGYVRLGSW